MRHALAISVLISATAIACGPKPAGTTGPTPLDPGAGAKAGKTRLDYETTMLQGAIYVPDGLATLPMPGGDKVIKRTVADQQKRFAKAKGAARVVEGEHLARLLWFSAGTDDGGKEQRRQAAGVLREIAPLGKAEERLVHMFAIAAQSTDQVELAMPAWEDLAERFPNSDHIGRYQAMIEVAKLRGGAPGTRVDEATWEAFYVNAWVAFTAGNDSVAVAALTTAAAAWPHVETLPALRRDIMLIFARAGVPAVDAMKVLEQLDKKDGGTALPVLHGLAQAYYFAGKDLEAITVLVVVIGLADPALKPEVLRMQAQVLFNVDDVDAATKAAHAAWGAVTAGGAAVTNERTAAVADTILHMGAHYTYAFALTQDRVRGEAAFKLLTLYMGIPNRADTAKVKTMQTELGKILDGTTKPAAGDVLAKQVVRGAVANHYEGVIACYERQLAKNRGLAGTINLAFTVAPDGKLSDISARPDVAEMQPVGQCIGELASHWSIPVGGVTEVSMPIGFAPAK